LKTDKALAAILLENNSPQVAFKSGYSGLLPFWHWGMCHHRLDEYKKYYM